MKPLISKSLSSSGKKSSKLVSKSIAAALKGPLLDKNKPEYTSYPSRFIYAVDVPEITNLTIDFIYNFFVPDEAVNDTDILSTDSVERMNLSQNIIKKNRFELSEDELSINRNKLPRYVKINFTPPNSEKINYGTSKQSSVISENFDKIVKEENFSTSFFSALTFNNRSLDAQTNVVFNTKNYTEVDDSDPLIDSTLRQVMSQQDIAENTIYRNGQGQVISNKYFESIKKLSTTIQVNSALLDDLVKSGAGNPLTPNFNSFQTYSNQSKALKNKFNDYRITDSDYETSINYYKIISRADSASTPSKSILLGYWIEKLELFPDGTKKKFDPIIIESSKANSYIDFDVRYGTTYVYEIRSIVEISYAAVDNKTYDVGMVSSLIASRGKMEYVETTENIGPPPPIEIKAIWDYGKINPATMEYDLSTAAPYPNTGKYGCLFLTWNFPINSQMDIKKIQIFRRKNLEEPFELIKMFDFDDSVIKYPLLEENIDKSLISYSENPPKSYYDFDFMKDSKYIYALCAIDAHGLSSEYSSQIAVKFDADSNKLITEIVSWPGAPKQYPNLYLAEDLFIDTMKSSNKRTMHVYFTPECYKTVDNNGQTVNIVGSQRDATSYVMNFINIENQNSSRLDINIIDDRSANIPYKKTISEEEKNQLNKALKKAKENGFLKKKIKQYKKIKSFF